MLSVDAAVAAGAGTRGEAPARGVARWFCHTKTEVSLPATRKTAKLVSSNEAGVLHTSLVIGDFSY